KAFFKRPVDLFGKVLFGQLIPIRNRLPLRYRIEMRCGCAIIRLEITSFSIIISSIDKPSAYHYLTFHTYPR
ncbi:MAG: hypothetical protein PVG14_19255, partial [Anaerolineales bacterium]